MCSQNKVSDILRIWNYYYFKFKISCKNFFRYVAFLPFLSHDKNKIKRAWGDALDWVNLKGVAVSVEYIWRKFLRESVFSEGRTGAEADRAWGAVSRWPPWLRPQGSRENSPFQVLKSCDPTHSALLLPACHTWILNPILISLLWSMSFSFNKENLNILKK